MGRVIKNTIPYELQIFFVAALWGACNTANKALLFVCSGVFINAVRCFLAAGTIGIVCRKNSLKWNKPSFFCGLVVGILMAAIFAVRAKALLLIPIGVCMFLSATYIVVIPIIMRVFLKKKIFPNQILAILLCVGGSALMCLNGDSEFTINNGVLLALGSAVLIALQMITIDCSKGFPEVDMNTLTLMEFLSAGCLFLLFLSKEEIITFVDNSLNLNTVFLLLFIGIIGTELATVLFNHALPHVSATRGSIIGSSESVFAALFGWLFLKESMSCWQIIGGVIILAGCIVATIQKEEIPPSFE